MAVSSTTIRKICPAPSELSGIKNNIPCPEKGCNSMFLNSSNLDMHLVKHHKKKHLDVLKKETNAINQYYCPVETCLYKLGSGRFFKCMKYLKQHYLKAHAEKKFLCAKCKKGYPTEAAMNYHQNVCGMKFICSCQNSYESYEALLTHAKRALHIFDKKFKISGKGAALQSQHSGNKTDENKIPVYNAQDTTTVTPFTVQLLTAIAINDLPTSHFKITQDREVQTEVAFSESKRTKKTPSGTLRVNERPTKRRTSAQTQTGCVSRNKQPKISTETQTGGDHILKKAIKAADILTSSQDGTTRQFQSRKRRKSMETQTLNQVNVNDEVTADFISSSESSIRTSNSSDYQHVNAIETDFTSQSRVSESCEVQCNSNLPDLWCGRKNFSNTGMLRKSQDILGTTFSHSQVPASSLEAQMCNNISGIVVSDTQNVENFDNYLRNMSSNLEILDDNTAQFSTSASSQMVFDVNSTMETADVPGFTQKEIESILFRNKSVVMNESQLNSIETQTEVDFNNIFFSDYVCDEDTPLPQTADENTLDHLIYSNTCTQTCDLLFPEFDFVDIETQTAWPIYDDHDTSALSDLHTDPSTSSFGNLTALSSEMNDIHTQTDINELEGFHLTRIIAELGDTVENDKIL